MGFRLSRFDASTKSPDQEELKGVSRLVNPRCDDPEIAAEEEDPGERDYLGRILHVADEALRNVKHGILRRKRRGQLH